MASTYTTGFGIEKIAAGEQSDTWGTTTNHNLDILDRIASYKAVALSGTTHTLTVREASPGSGTENLQDGMYRVIKFTGALGGNNTVTIAPNTSPAWFIIENATTDSGSSGPYTVILTQGSGANVTVQNGKNAIIYCDGAGSGAAVVNALADLQVGTLEVTGAAAVDGLLTAGASVAVTGNVTATGTVEPAGDTAASDNAAIGYTAAEGLILTGQGSTSDITLKNDADGTVFTVPTGTDDVLFPDSAKAMWGAGSDLQIFHDGSNSYVQDTGTGSLFVEGSSVTIRNSGGTEAMASFTPDGAVSLYYNNAIKLATAATGVTMTGEVTATGFTGTLDGVLGGGTPAAASVTTLGATGVISAADGSVSAPSISFSSDTNNGLAYINADNWGLVVGGAWNWYFQAAQNYTNVNLLALNAAGPGLLNEAATSTNPTLVPNRADLDTGMGWVSADIGSLVAGGVSALSWNASADVGIKHAAPLVSLHVQDSALSGSDTWTADVQAVFGRNGNAGIALYAGATNVATFKFAKPADYNVGQFSYNFATDVLNFTLAATSSWAMAAGSFAGANAAGPALLQEAATATNPTLAPNKADPNTGVGWVSADIGSLVAGGAETLRWASGTTTVTGDFFTSNAQGGGLIDDVASTTVPTILPRRGITNTGLGSSSGFTTFITSGALIATLNSTAFEMANAAGPSILNEAATATNPTLVPNKADPNTGIGWVSADSFNFVTGGGGRLTISDASIVSGVAISMTTATGPTMLNEAATATNPTLAPNKADPNTGMGWVSADIGSLVAGGVEALRWANGTVTIAGNLATAAGGIATASLADNAVTLAKMAGGTDGNLITYDASGDPAYVAAGSSGQVLTSQGAGSVPVFASGGGGKILQVVEATTTTQVETTSTSYVDTGLTGSITPSATDSKILVLISLSVNSAAGAAVAECKIVRTIGSTATDKYVYSQISAPENQKGNHFLSVLDSPSSTSACVYKVQAFLTDQSATLQFQRNDGADIARSTITLMEVGA